MDSSKRMLVLAGRAKNKRELSFVVPVSEEKNPGMGYFTMLLGEMGLEVAPLTVSNSGKSVRTALTVCGLIALPSHARRLPRRKDIPDSTYQSFDGRVRFHVPPKRKVKWRTYIPHTCLALWWGWRRISIHQGRPQFMRFPYKPRHGAGKTQHGCIEKITESGWGRNPCPCGLLGQKPLRLPCNPFVPNRELLENKVRKWRKKRGIELVRELKARYG